jgi:hypothetical protein
VSDPSDAAAFDAMNAEAVATPNARAVGAPVQPCPLAQRVRVRIALRDLGFRLRAGVRYTLVVDGTTYAGHAGADGVVDQVLPGRPRAGRLAVWEGATARAPSASWELEFDTLHPIAVPTGARGRLANLGFRVDHDDEPGPQTRAAIEEFQCAFGLDPTGRLDDATKARLRAVSDTTADDAIGDEGWTPDAYRPRPGATR